MVLVQGRTRRSKERDILDRLKKNKKKALKWDFFVFLWENISEAIV